MSDTQTEAKPNRARRWMRGVLIISLTLNLLVVGIVAGGLIGNARGMPRPMITDVSMGVFTEAFSLEDREALRLAAEGESQAIREMHRASREDYERLIAAIRQQPWDEAGASAALQGYSQRSIDRIQTGERFLLKRLGEMSPQARRAFADRLEESLRRASRTPRQEPGRAGNR